MDETPGEQENTRGISQAALVVVAITVVLCASLAGAIVVSEFLDPTAEPYNAVPADADVVVSVDPVGFAQDPVTTSAGNEVLAVTDGNQSYQELLATTLEDTNAQLNSSLTNYSASDVGLAVQDVGEIVIFADSDAVQQASPVSTATGGTAASVESTESEQSPYVGAVIELDLSGDDVGEVLSALDGQESEEDAEVSTYKGRQVVTVDGAEGEQPAAVANLGPGLLGVGPPRVVRDIVDTHVGDAAGIPEYMKPDVDGERYLGVAVANPTELDTQNLTGTAPSGAEYRYVTLAYGTVNGEQARLNAEFGMDINGTRATTSVTVRADSPMIDFFIRETLGGFVNSFAARPIAVSPTQPVETTNRTGVPG
jgi:hypothetical protein